MKQIDQNQTGTEAVQIISNLDIYIYIHIYIYIKLQNVLNNKIY